MGTRRRPQPWNHDIEDSPADEKIYTDFTDDNRTIICDYKLKTKAIERWVQAHKEKYPEGKWTKNEGSNQLILESQEYDKKLVVSFSLSSGVVMAQGAGMHSWQLRTVPDMRADMKATIQDNEDSITFHTPGNSPSSQSQSPFQKLKNKTLRVLNNLANSKKSTPKVDHDSVSDETISNILDPLSDPLSASSPCAGTSMVRKSLSLSDLSTGISRGLIDTVIDISATSQSLVSTQAIPSQLWQNKEYRKEEQLELLNAAAHMSLGDLMKESVANSEMSAKNLTNASLSPPPPEVMSPPTDATAPVNAVNVSMAYQVPSVVLSAVDPALSVAISTAATLERSLTNVDTNVDTHHGASASPSVATSKAATLEKSLTNVDINATSKAATATLEKSLTNVDTNVDTNHGVSATSVATSKAATLERSHTNADKNHGVSASSADAHVIFSTAPSAPPASPQKGAFPAQYTAAPPPFNPVFTAGPGVNFLNRFTTAPNLPTYPTPPTYLRAFGEQNKDVLSQIFGDFMCEISSLKTQLTNSNDQILNEISGLKGQVDERDQLIADLMVKIDERDKFILDLVQGSSTSDSDKIDHLLIGSSLVQLVDENQLKKTKVHCKPGAHPAGLTRVFDAKVKAGEKFESVTILVGGNRLKKSNPGQNVSAAAEEVIAAAESAKRITDKVRILELPPRLNSDAMVAAISDLNDQVKEKCTAHGFEFVPTHGSFFLANGYPNRALINQKDKVHLTDIGTELLLECAGIELLDPRDPRRGVKSKEEKQSLSDNPPQAIPDLKSTKGQKFTAPTPNIPSKGPKFKRQGDNSKGKDRAPNHKASTGHAKQQRGPPMGGQSRFFTHASRENEWQNPPRHAQQHAWFQPSAAQQHARFQPSVAPQHAWSQPSAAQQHAWSQPPAAQQHAWSQPPAAGYRGRGWPQDHVNSRPPPGPKPEAGTPPPGSAQGKYPKLTCHRCEFVGHHESMCNSHHSPCFKCGRFGHYKRVCRY